MAATRVVVFGASGDQGSNVVDALLKTGKFEVVGVTRNKDSDSAKAKGAAFAAASPKWAGWVSADADKPETLGAALAGASATFIVTNFWEHHDGPREERQGNAMVDAAAAAGVQTIVYSGLDSPLKRFGIAGALHLEHKYAVEEYLFNSPTTAAVPHKVSVRAACYQKNFASMMIPRPSQSGDGTFTLALPMGDKPLKLVDLRDYGATVAAVLAAPARYNKRRLNVVSSYVTGAQMAAAIGAAVDAPVHYYPVPIATYAAFGFPGAEDLAAMFAFFQACALEADDEPIVPKASLHGFTEWAVEHAAALRAAMNLPAKA